MIILQYTWRKYIECSRAHLYLDMCIIQVSSIKTYFILKCVLSRQVTLELTSALMCAIHLIFYT